LWIKQKGKLGIESLWDPNEQSMDGWDGGGNKEEQTKAVDEVSGGKSSASKDSGSVTGNRGSAPRAILDNILKSPLLHKGLAGGRRK